jgi:hypothetical protein
MIITMKKISLLAALFTISGFLTLQAQNLTHTVWKAFFGEPVNDTISWHFEKDTSFVLSSTGDLFVRSHIKTVKDTLFISDYDGQYQCAGMDAKYTFTIKGDELNFVLIDDACQGRNAIATITWMKVKPKME